MREAGFTTFLVDDDPAVLKAITRLLNAAGYRTKSFSSPQEFLSAHDPSIPGCAIIDLVMSELDGLHLQQALLETGSERPIIFLSGKGDVSTSVRAMKAGAVDFLTKPVKREALFSAVVRAAKVDALSRQKRDESKSIGVRHRRSAQQANRRKSRHCRKDGESPSRANDVETRRKERGRSGPPCRQGRNCPGTRVRLTAGACRPFGQLDGFVRLPETRADVAKSSYKGCH